MYAGIDAIRRRKKTCAAYNYLHTLSHRRNIHGEDVQHHDQIFGSVILARLQCTQKRQHNTNKLLIMKINP